MRWLRPASILAALLAIGHVTEVRGQSSSLSTSDPVAAPRPTLTLSAGAFQFDRAGPGTAPVLAARGELPLSHVFLIEGGLAAARAEPRFRGMTTLLVPEAQLQAQFAAGPWVAPYVGAGVGAALGRTANSAARTERDLTLSAATGVRYWISEDRGLRAEVRVRRVGPELGGSAAEWTLGSSWRL